jgi:ABC-2 type transport system ATP-binding protein
MIEVRDLVKDYGAFRAVRNVSFSVAKGEVVGFLGPNGAGKSTTLRIVAGFLGATSGVVRVNGHDVVEEPLAARASIGYMPEAAPLYPEMRVREYLGFRAELKGVPSKERKAAVRRAMEDAGLLEMEQVLIGQLSKGYRQRVGIGDALVASPPLLLLDEPTAGLDPNQIREVRALINRLRERHTVLVSTHILSEVETMCTRGVLIARGQLIAEGTLDELRALRRPRSVKMRVRARYTAAEKIALEVEGVSSSTLESETRDGTTRLVLAFADEQQGEATTEALVHAFSKAGVGVHEVTPTSSLEHVFAQLTTDAEVTA